MARPIKPQQVDYFPHMCKHGKTLFIVEERFKNDGYAFWFKLLEMLGSENGHVLDTNQPDTWEFIQSRTFLSSDRCREILDLLARLDAIDKDLWLTKNVIWCQNYVDNLCHVYKKRATETPKKPSFRSGNPPSEGVSGAEIQQSIAKQSIAKQSITAAPEIPDSGPPAEPTPPALGCLSENEWNTYRRIWDPILRGGPFPDEDGCKAYWAKHPAQHNQWIKAAKNYAVSKKVIEGFAMNPMKFLTGRWKEYQTAETPTGPDAQTPDRSWKDEREKDEAALAEFRRKVEAGEITVRPRERFPTETVEEYERKKSEGKLAMVKA